MTRVRVLGPFEAEVDGRAADLGGPRQRAVLALLLAADRHIALSVFQFDDDMIVNVHLADLLGHDSPTLHVRRHGKDGLYDRFSLHIEHLWDSGQPYE